MTSIFCQPEKGTSSTNQKGIKFARKVRKKSIRAFVRYANVSFEQAANDYDEIFKAHQAANAFKVWAVEYVYLRDKDELGHVVWLDQTVKVEAS